MGRGAHRRRRGIAAQLAAVLVAMVLPACTSSGAPAPGARPGDAVATGGTAPTSSPLPADDPIRRAEDFLRGFDLGGAVDDEITPESVVVLDYVARRWGRPPLADPADALALLGPAGSHPGLARLYDATVELSPTDAAHLHTVMGPALFCELHGIPADYDTEVREHIDLGGYEATHVLLSLVWIGELGCTMPDREALLDAAIDRVARELRESDAVTDLSAEQIAFLDYAGAIDRVDPSWEQVLVSSQLDDGGWPEDPGSLGRWHTAGTAWWALLAFREPGNLSTHMVPRGRS